MTAPSTTGANGNFVIVADYGDIIEVHEDEVYNDRAYAWKMADEMQAEADADDDAVVVYGVYTLTAADR
jgi:hypothetical protein